MTNAITKLGDKYGIHFDILVKKDRAYVASVILMHISQAYTPNDIPSLAEALDMYVTIASDAANECLQDIASCNFDRVCLLDICSALLAGCR
ncbi:hypothetical protein QT972_09655 [Microcoleus sp. herbarium7]|uniref:hypothetical protein n=1 Tax=Microcoleus sp. herbarium7 TaxID=3055435 RepID=UPI002FD5E9C0